MNADRATTLAADALLVALADANHYGEFGGDPDDANDYLTLQRMLEDGRAVVVLRDDGGPLSSPTG